MVQAVEHFSEHRDPVILHGKDRRHTKTWGVGVTLLVSSEQTGGKYTIIDYVSPPTGLGPPLHLHREMDETFHVTEGGLNFQVADRRVVAGPGTIVHVPAGTPHAFWNSSGSPARMLVTFSPGGFERYLLDLFKLSQSHPEPTNDLRPIIAQLGEKYDQVVLGPSPALS